MSDRNFPSLEQVLSDLYDCEINVGLFWFWDSGVDLSLGDQTNGYKAKDRVQTVGEAAEWLIENAVRAYPRSAFAIKYSEFARGAEVIPLPSGRRRCSSI